VRNHFLVFTCVLTLTATGANSLGSSLASAYESVKIPLDKSEKRFGNFYVRFLDGHLYRPNSNQPSPTIILLHGCGGFGGVSLRSAENRAEHFATLGYASLILDVDDDRKLGQRPCNERAINFPLLDARSADIDAATGWLTAEKISIPGKITALGTSHGAQVVIEHDKKTGGSARLAGGIANYPGCDIGKPSARYPLLILVGDQDFTDGPGKSLRPICSGYAAGVNRAGGAKAEAVVYPGAAHGFEVEGLKAGTSDSLNKSGSGYDAAAAEASFRKVDEFLLHVFQ